MYQIASQRWWLHCKSNTLINQISVFQNRHHRDRVQCAHQSNTLKFEPSNTWTELLMNTPDNRICMVRLNMPNPLEETEYFLLAQYNSVERSTRLQIKWSMFGQIKWSMFGLSIIRSMNADLVVNFDVAREVNIGSDVGSGGRRSPCFLFLRVTKEEPNLVSAAFAILHLSWNDLWREIKSA